MTTAKPRLIPGPDHPIDITPHEGRVIVRVGERTLADTAAALELHEASYPAVLYVPRADLDSALLVDSDTETYCPYKGEASYFSVAATSDAEPIKDAIWYYSEPYDAVAQIADHVAFYPDRVEIVADSA